MTTSSSDTQHPSRVRAIFDDWARHGRGATMAAAHEPNARQAFDRLGLDARCDARYLDVGCGIGYTVRWAAAQSTVREAVGIDLAPNMISTAREASKDLSPQLQDKLHFATASFPNHGLDGTCLRPQSFDAIFSMEVLYYLPDMDAALCEIHRLLRTGGRFACAVDYYQENTASHGWPAALGCTMNLLDTAGWRAAFEGAGLKIIEQTRLLEAPGDGVEPWKTVEGSLLTVGERA